MRRRARALIYLGALLLGTVIVYAQATGIPSRLRVKTDANNYLLTTGVAYTAPDSALQNFNNIRLRTDANGYLLTTTGTGGSSFSGPILEADGTSGAPSYSFTSEPTLGFWRSGAGTITAQGTLVAVAYTTTGASGNYYVVGRAGWKSTADGIFQVTNFGQTIGANLKVDALPTAGTCGTSPAVTAGSTPFAGSINVGTGTPASCVLIFGGTAWPSAPFCTANIVSATASEARAIAVVPTTTQVTFTPATAFVASQVVSYTCVSSK